MDTSGTAAEAGGSETELKLDLTGLLGSNQVFAAGSDPRVGAELIDANCNKIGTEGDCIA